MRRFRVRFCNDLVDSYGHERRACQASFEIEGSSPEAAIELAKRLFEEEERIPRWRDRAQVFECEDLG
jgi:hypothetical protein